MPTRILLHHIDFVSANAREMDSTVMNNHIKLFVNDFTLNLGYKG